VALQYLVKAMCLCGCIYNPLLLLPRKYCDIYLCISWL